MGLRTYPPGELKRAHLPDRGRQFDPNDRRKSIVLFWFILAAYLAVAAAVVYAAVHFVKWAWFN
jgi:hypothetical protein